MRIYYSGHRQEVFESGGNSNFDTHVQYSSSCKNLSTRPYDDHVCNSGGYFCVNAIDRAMTGNT